MGRNGGHGEFEISDFRFENGEWELMGSIKS
jgi:hypothetical protein